jgi:hypothetical protein
MSLGHLNKTIHYSLNESERTMIDEFLKLHFFGDDEITTQQIQNHPQDVIDQYKNALAKVRGDQTITLSLLFNFNGDSSGTVVILGDSCEISKIKEQLKCSESCAKDVYSLRRESTWSKESEEELINLHNAGVPSDVSLLSSIGNFSTEG